MRHAQVKSLADIAESVSYGYTASATQAPVGPHFLRITDIVPQQIDWASVPYCKIEEKDRERFSIKPGDIVIARTGATVGYAKLIRNHNDAVFASYLIRIRVDQTKADPGYVVQIVESDVYKKFVLSQVGGAAQPNANARVLSSFKLPIPAIQLQRRIAGTLATYDDLIENNRRRIQLLEQAARLLYKEWFIYLRFPGHEHVKIKDGVPEGWEKRQLSAIADITMGQSPKSIYYNEDGNGLPFHQGVTNYGTRFPSHQIYCTLEGRLAEPDDILFSVRAPVGRINITLDKIVIGRGLAAIRSNIGQQNLLFYALKSHFFKEDMIGGGAIFAAITKKDLYEVELVQPPDRFVEMFMAHVRPLDLQIENLHRSNNRLVEARDILLPCLMKGEVAV